MTAGPHGNRLIFANQLRGLAALFVAGSHLVGVFWAMQPFLALAGAAPEQGGTPPSILRLFSNPWLQFGPFGVGVFFLISGLVIPISLETHSRPTFLLARALRIYPVCWAALAIDVAVLHGNAAYWGRPFPFNDATVWSNALLVYGWVGLPCLDLVNWTLCIELLFYLLMAAVAPAVRRGSIPAVFAVAAGLLAVNATFAAIPWATPAPPWAVTAGTYAPPLIFMLIGTLFQFHLRGRLGTASLAAGIAGLSACFMLCWRLGPTGAQVPVVTVSYGHALLLFTAAYALRRFARPMRLLDGMAAISFPFYLVHSTLGYSVLKYLMVARGWSYGPALAAALAAIVVVAAALHAAVERPTMRAGKRLRRLSRAALMADSVRQPPEFTA